MQDTELRNCFSSYDFHANKDELAQILNHNTLHVKVLHHIQTGTFEIGEALVPLNRILAAPLKRTPQAEVRVYDDEVEIKDGQTGQFKGILRVLVYLEDTGEAKAPPKAAQSLAKAREQRGLANTSVPPGSGTFGANFQIQSSPEGMVGDP